MFFDSPHHRVGLRCLGTVPDIKLPDFPAKNEPVLQYLKGSKERKEIEAAAKKIAGTVEDVPIVIGDKDYKSSDVRYQVMPHNHKHKIAKFYYANAELLKKAIDVAVEAQKKWDRVPLNKRSVCRGGLRVLCDLLLVLGWIYGRKRLV